MTNHGVHERCGDCLAVAEEFMADAVWLSQAGQTTANPEVVVDLLAYDMWQEVSELHDAGAA